MKKTALILALLCTPHLLHADTLLDDFESGVAVTTDSDRPWGTGTRWRPAPGSFQFSPNNYYTATPVGGANALRSISDTSVGINSAHTTSLVSQNGGSALQYNNSVGGQAASGATTDANKVQALFLHVIKNGGNYNASSDNYIRFTVSIPATAVVPPNAIFAMNMLQEPTAFLGNTPTTPVRSCAGPFNPGTGNFDGITPTTTPTVYVIPIKNPSYFKVIPTMNTLYNSIAGTTGVDYSIADWTKIRNIQFGYFRFGAPAGASVLGTPAVNGRFIIDDIILSTNAPGISYSPSSVSVTEGAAGTVVGVSLAARPSHSVTVTLANSADYTFSSNSLTFTTANWSTAQNVTVTAVNDAAIEGNESLSTTPGKSSSDLWYAAAGNVLAALPVTVVDDDFPPPVLDTFSLSSGATYTNSTTVSFGVTGSAGPFTAIEADEDSGFGSLVSVAPGSPTYTFDSAANGVKTVYARLAGPGGTSSALNDTITLDTQAPVLSVASLVTNDPTPDLNGTVSDNIAVPGSVSVTVDSVAYPATPSAGAWNVTVTNPLAEGTYNVSAMATDPAGNAGADPTMSELVVDLTAPAIGVDALTTNDQTPTLSGTISDAVAVPATVNVNVDGSNYTGTVSGGTWTANVTAALGEGSYAVTVTGVDTAGNVGIDATTSELVIDLTAPSITVASLTTNNTTPTLTGTISDAISVPSTVNVNVDGGNYTGTVSSGSWTANVTVALGDGTYPVTVTGVDTAGNVGIDGTNNELVIDLTAPVQTQITVDQGDVKIGGTITGTYDASETGTASLYFRPLGGSWTSASVLGGAAANTWSFDPTGDGVYQFTVVAADGFGNALAAPSGSTASTPVTGVVHYNDVANSIFPHTVDADGSYRFPMTETESVTITFSGVTGSNPVTVSRTMPMPGAPAGFDGARLINEVLDINGSFTGTATIAWQFDPASDNALSGALDTVFQFESGVLVNSYSVTPSGNTLTINGVTAFSEWYAGNNAATVADWTLLDD